MGKATSAALHAAERRTQPFALMSRLSVFGVLRAQTLAVFTLTEAIPRLVGWRELFANRPFGGVRTGHNLSSPQSGSSWAESNSRRNAAVRRADHPRPARIDR